MPYRDENFEFQSSPNEPATEEQIKRLENAAEWVLENTAIQEDATIELRKQYVIRILGPDLLTAGHLVLLKSSRESQPSDVAAIMVGADMETEFLRIEHVEGQLTVCSGQVTHEEIYNLLDCGLQAYNDPQLNILLRRLKKTIQITQQPTHNSNNLQKSNSKHIASLIGRIVDTNDSMITTYQECGYAFDSSHVVTISCRNILSMDSNSEQSADIPQLTICYEDRDTPVTYTYIIMLDKTRLLYVSDNSTEDNFANGEKSEHIPLSGEVELLTEKLTDMVIPDESEIDTELFTLLG
jgi:hypothetical protein